MLRRLGQGSCWAKAPSEAAFWMTSEREPLEQNSMTMQTGARHRPMNMTTLGWRMAAMMDTCVTLTHVVLSELSDHTDVGQAQAHEHWGGEWQP